MKQTITTIICLLVAFSLHAQYTGPGYYRVHNVGSDSYINIKGTHYEKSTRPDAFWSCVKMTKDSAQIADPGSIIYIPDTVQVGLYAQGVDTYSLTGLPIDVQVAPVMQGGLMTYVAKTLYNGFNCVFRDYGNGMTAGSNPAKAECNWWIEPVNENSMDSSFLGVLPVITDVKDADGWYWATICCDFPILLPEGGGVEGAYTINNEMITKGSDDFYYAEPTKLYGQGEIVPAATPVLLKCAFPYASGNKIVPFGKIANCTDLPIVSNMLMGNYFSDFTNFGDLNDYSVTKVYIPEQATLARVEYMALSVDAEGHLAFMPKEEGTYMDANTAWLNIEGLNLEGVVAIRLGAAPVDEIMPGDANGDRVIDISDVTIITSEILNGTSDDIPESYDVNGDGKVDIEDVTYLINSVLNDVD